uniref:Uncharacterized protein n=1 Tax=Rhizophora mucronata TaxID=61149 RepID=A0A2P2QGS1_RHIMU
MSFLTNERCIESGGGGGETKGNKEEF